MKIDIGCGAFKKSGFTGIDIRPVAGVDIIHDLSKPIPIPDNSVEEVYCSHFLEHIGDALPLLLKEIVRVSKNNAKVTFKVPYWSMEGAMFYGHKNTMPPLQFLQLSGKTSLHDREFWFDTKIGWLELIHFSYKYNEEGKKMCYRLGITPEEGAKFLNNIVEEMTVEMKVIKA
jgi:ubiquinone/menaquinone biosynthesis C-methylase UbiE